MTIPDADLRLYMLAEIRLQTLKAKALAAEIEAIGIVLGHSMIGPHEAIKALREAGGWPLLAHIEEIKPVTEKPAK